MNVQIDNTKSFNIYALILFVFNKVVSFNVEISLPISFNLVIFQTYCVKLRSFKLSFIWLTNAKSNRSFFFFLFQRDSPNSSDDSDVAKAKKNEVNIIETLTREHLLGERPLPTDS